MACQVDERRLVTRIGLATFRGVIAIALLVLSAFTMMFTPLNSGLTVLLPLIAYALLTIVSTIEALKGRGAKYSRAESLATGVIIALLALIYLFAYKPPEHFLMFCGWIALVGLNYLAFRKLANSAN